MKKINPYLKPGIIMIARSCAIDHLRKVSKHKPVKSRIITARVEKIATNG
jgi:hypothetical protein